jgi:hypothetical protein
MTKKDCKIVQDLLPSYVDKLLSPETEEFVEQHISNCEECKKILDVMKNKNVEKKNESENIQKKEINHLKKYRLKMISLKTILISILTIILVVSGLLIYKSNYNNSIITRLYDKIQQIKESNNYILKREQYTINYKTKAEYTFTTIVYYKDGKYKEVHTVDSPNVSMSRTNYSYYGEINSNQRTGIFEDTKTVIYENANYEYRKKGDGMYGSGNYAYVKNWHFLNFVANLGFDVQTERYNGKECYVLIYGDNKNSSRQTWIEKESMLPIREIMDVDGVNYIETKITLQLDKATDSDVEMPNIDGYEVKNITTNMDTEVLKIIESAFD